MIANFRTAISLVLLLLVGLFEGAFAAPSRIILVKPSPFALALEASGIGAGTALPGRPLLGRTGYAISGQMSFRDPHWTWFAWGIDGFNLGESLPDSSLFLYRGYGGNSIFVGTGPRFALSGLGWRPVANSSLDITGEIGLSATEDTGTTLVSLLPFFRLDSRLVNPLSPYWSWSLGLPLELQRKATALTWMGALSLSLVWTPFPTVRK